MSKMQKSREMARPKGPGEMLDLKELDLSIIPDLLEAVQTQAN